MTAAEKLRRAAEVLRERVQTAQQEQTVTLALIALERLWGVGFRSSTVAIAVADWLEVTAAEYDRPPCDAFEGTCNRCQRTESYNSALAVAVAILAGVEG